LTIVYAIILCLSSLNCYLVFLAGLGFFSINSLGVSYTLSRLLVVSIVPPLCGSYSISSYLTSGAISGIKGTLLGSPFPPGFPPGLGLFPGFGLGC